MKIHPRAGKSPGHKWSDVFLPETWDGSLAMLSLYGLKEDLGPFGVIAVKESPLDIGNPLPKPVGEDRPELNPFEEVTRPGRDFWIAVLRRTAEKREDFITELEELFARLFTLLYIVGSKGIDKLPLFVLILGNPRERPYQ